MNIIIIGVAEPSRNAYTLVIGKENGLLPNDVFFNGIYILSARHATNNLLPRIVARTNDPNRAHVLVHFIIESRENTKFVDVMADEINGPSRKFLNECCRYLSWKIMTIRPGSFLADDETHLFSSGAFDYSAANPLDRNIIDLWAHSMGVVRSSIDYGLYVLESEMSTQLKFIEMK